MCTEMPQHILTAMHLALVNSFLSQHIWGQISCCGATIPNKHIYHRHKWTPLEILLKPILLDKEFKVPVLPVTPA